MHENADRTSPEQRAGTRARSGQRGSRKPPDESTPEFGRTFAYQISVESSQQHNDQAHPPPEAQRPKRGTSEGNEAVGGRVQRLVSLLLLRRATRLQQRARGFANVQKRNAPITKRESRACKNNNQMMKARGANDARATPTMEEI